MKAARSGVVGLLFALLLFTARASAQQPPPLPQTFSIPPTLELELTTDWTQLRDQPPPPPSQLIVAAPKFNFTDVLVLQNDLARSMVKVLVSDNAFEGSSPTALDAQMHRTDGLLNHFFYLFFPPPRTCLVEARAAVEAAKTKDEPKPSIQRRCRFSPTLADFFASQISPGAAFTGNEGRPLGLKRFYLAPTESIELNGKTFFIFEALAGLAIDRAEVDQFNLPDELLGAHAHFFWAVGTDSPFPFVHDLARKNVRLVHLVYASLSRSGEGRDEFRAMLGKLQF